MAQTTIDIAIRTKGQRELQKLHQSTVSTERQLERLQGGLDRSSTSLRRTGQSAAAASGGLTRFANSSRSAQSAAEALAGKLGKLAATYGLLRVAQDAVQTGIQRIESGRRLESLASGFNEVAAAQAAAGRAAQKFGIGQNEANQSFAQIYARLRPIGVSLRDIESSFAGFNTAAKLSGTSAQEASSAWLQLGQALGSGVLRGEELNSVFEQTPLVVQAIAREMDQPIGKIRELAKDGKITSDIVIRALRRIETEGADKLAAALKGPAQQVKNMENAFEDLKVEAAERGMPAIISGVKLLTLTTKGLNSVLELTFDWLQSIASVDLSALNSGLDAVLRKGMAGDYSRRIGLAEAAGLAGLAPSQKVDQLGALLREIQASPQRQNLGGAQAQLEAVRTIGRNLRGINAEANPSLNPRLEKLQGIVMQLDKSLSGTVTRLEKEAKTSPAAPKPPQSKVEELKEDKVSKKVAGTVIEYLTGDKSSPNYRADHGGSNYHEHLAFKTPEQMQKAMKALQAAGIKIGSTTGGQHAPGSYHYRGQAFDVPASQVPVGREQLLSEKVRDVLAKAGFVGQGIGGEGGNAIAEILAEHRDLMAESVKEGQKLEQQFTRELEIRRAATSQEKALLQIRFDTEDRQAQINELMNDGQRASLTVLNQEQQRLEVLEAQVRSIYEQADAAALLSKSYRGGAGAFRTDLNLDPNQKQGKVQEYLTQLQTELGDTEGQITSLAQSIEGQLGGAMSSAVTSLIQGTQTAEKAMADMFAGIGKAFIEMATQMIAKALILKVLGVLGGGSGGSLFSGAGPFQFGGGGSGADAFMPGFAGFFANGGTIPPGQFGVVGEAGPELISSTGGGTHVTPMHEAMQRYAHSGSRSGGAGGAGGGDGAGGGAPVTVNYTGPTLNFNGDEYLPKSAVPEIIAASAKQGAAQGHTKSMRTLQNSRSQRAKLGLR